MPQSASLKLVFAEKSRIKLVEGDNFLEHVTGNDEKIIEIKNFVTVSADIEILISL